MWYNLYEKQLYHTVYWLAACSNIQSIHDILMSFHQIQFYQTNDVSRQDAINSIQELGEIQYWANELDLTGAAAYYMLNNKVDFQQELLDKHYFRKHGAGAYYGQK